MRVLFVSSGKSGDVGIVVKNQGESLRAFNVVVDYYLIKPGLIGYLSSIPELRRIFKKKNFDLAHAHYSLSGLVASIAGCKPLIVSLMGSDTFGSKSVSKLTRFFSRHIWDKTIVKTSELKERLVIPEALVIPNGVNIERFKPVPKKEARNHLNISEDCKLIIFIAIKNRPEKNLGLALEAVKLLNDKNILFKHVHDADNSEIPFYLNAADVLLLTSRWEGSVNVVKEAMACNCPVVSTNVGDVSRIIEDTEGCFITSFEPEDVAVKIKTALDFGQKTDGRDRIIKAGLDSKTVALRIIGLYEQVLEGK
jgi:glycosyltransferase involved in cell wall biosynthesis